MTLFFLALLVAWCFSFCKKTSATSADFPFRNVRDSVAYVGMATCASCHKDIHETFQHTGMGRSFDHATLQKTTAKFGSHAVVFDSLRNFYYHPFFKDSTMFVLEYRLGENGDTIHRRLEKISYIVGSGQHTNSHILDINGYIYQAPVTWYTQEERWDLAPGFKGNNSHFGRWLTEECITCHNNLPEQVPGSMNRFSKMPTGIQCERCHGPGKLHVEEKLKGILVDTSKQADYSIVNPRRLPRDLQMDLCQRCHLQGVAVLNEGKTFFDFKPGMRLSEVLNVYLPRYTDSHERFIMASQADRLRMSECFKNSPDLSCITCHQPHRSVEITPASQYNNACLKCHASTACTEKPELRHSKSDNCASCHMPKSVSKDIPHVRITDHRIAKHNEAKTVAAPQKKAFLGIQNMTQARPSPLDMARGYLATHDKYIASPVMLDSAAFYLAKSTEKAERLLPVRIHLLFLKEDWKGILASIPNSSIPKFPNSQLPTDGWTPYRIGEAYSNTGDAETALRYFDLALQTYPLHLDFLEKKGAALLALKRIAEAKKVFENVLKLNPDRPIALLNLGYANVLTNNLPQAEKLYNEALALDPDYEQALVNKAALLIFQGKKAEAKRLLERALVVNPESVGAREGLGRL
ncbi:MAG: tetratricopeptide repeat protein [Saprospiraceae bacterium]|nr:tetratricopeptide repeat protein [Saprospiraceae bacterium]MCF8251735.1 tetratricopeptide repeat protein [Saprospiraceae bacterium]MCF8311789.1 tetratricopeptide repeat protein [Saprospiraceae bacterium]MCF8441761.1 tetratricopeptide repeat protein [Saprospiraceae bacterium]